MKCDVLQVTVFDRNILGAVAVKFKREEDAEACVLVMCDIWHTAHCV